MLANMTDPKAVIILSGPPGAGKSTIARRLAQRQVKAVHLHTDTFWHFIASGGIPPYEAAAYQQNQMVLDIIARTADGYARGGFTTIVDGVVGPWMLHHFQQPGQDQPEPPLHYLILRPSRPIALTRAQQRGEPTALTQEPAVLGMWDQFADVGELERHVLDTSDEDADTSLESVLAAVESRRYLLRTPP